MSIAHSHFPTQDHPHLGVIDGLRAIAVLMIVWFHFWQQSWLSSSFSLFGNQINLDLIPRTGFLGVELLLFISGFGLFLPYAQKMVTKSEIPKIGEYTFHRFIRIVPSYYLSLLLVLLFTQPFHNLTELLWNTLTHVLFIHNFFPETWGSINGVLWTLGIEIQFYLIFPLIAYFFTKKPFWTYLALFIIAISYRFCVQAFYPSSIYYYLNQMPGFLDFYASGMLSCYLYILISHKFQLPNLAKFCLTLISILGFGAFYFTLAWVDHLLTIPDGLTVWQAHNREWLALVFIVITISSLLSFKFWQIFLSNKLFLFISIVSFNLYLYHQIIAFQLEKYHIPGPRPEDPRQNPAWQIQFTIICIILSLMIATVLTYGFERPLAKWGLKKFSKN